MKTKIFALFAAMMLLVGTTAMAQSDNTKTTETEIKGDVNNDGIVDVADIAAVIAVMNEQGTVAPQYYWYAGWTEPTEANIGEIINETYPATNNDSTEHIAGGSTNDISTINADYSDNKLFDNRILSGGTMSNYYVVVPNGLLVYNTIGGVVCGDGKALRPHSTFANHTVYKSSSASVYINAIIIKK